MDDRFQQNYSLCRLSNLTRRSDCFANQYVLTVSIFREPRCTCEESAVHYCGILEMILYLCYGGEVEGEYTMRYL